MAKTTVPKPSVNSNSFILEIKSRENGTWQGSVRRVGTDEVIPFRSALELIRLLDSAVNPDRECVRCPDR